MSDPGFKSVLEMYEHLMLPENHITTDLFVIRWDGLRPSIARSRLEDLKSSRALAEVTYLEYLRRKRRPKEEPEAEDV